MLIRLPNLLHIYSRKFFVLLLGNLSLKGQIASLTRHAAFVLRLLTADIHCYNLYTLSDLESDFQGIYLLKSH